MIALVLRFICAVILLFSFSSCRLQKVKRYDYQNRATQEEAVPYDVPLSIGARALSKKTFPNGLLEISYSTRDSLLRVASFYKNEMERLGWALSSEFLTNEYILIFEKPYALCHVLIKTVSEHETQISIKFQSDSDDVH
ncbi:MAG TPA: hypothetical protein VHO47_01420 [Candidatus Babeliales bacterium]|nr:hypothetical protein [Candidatus Babeliales bacterium]